MQTSQPKSPSILNKRNNQFLRLRFVIFIILFLLFAWVTITFNVRGFIHDSWLDGTSAILAICGALLSVLQLLCWRLFSFSYNKPEVPTFIGFKTSSLETHYVNQQLPPAASLTRTVHRSIVGLPPATDTKTIVQREGVVEDILRKLTRPETTAIVLTGLDGVGKSTLAALVFRYTEEQIRAKKSYFTAPPLWLVIDPDVTMAELASNLFEALDEPIPDFDKLSPHSQAVALLKALDTTEQARLIILDSFERLLDWQTGHLIADPGISELLIALNSGRCKCKLLFTSRTWPQGPQMYPRTYMQEYQVKGLEINEGVELLRKQGIEGTERELSRAVKYCAGHAFALTLLAALLRNRKMSLDILFKDRTYAQLWMGNVASNLLNYIYQQLSEIERKVLLAFSVYREPVPLDAVKTIIDSSSVEVTTAQIQFALGVLIRQHLLQASGDARYQLHAVVSRQAQEHFVGGDEQENQQVLKKAHVQAAQYYLRQSLHSPLRGKRRETGDVHPFIEAIWHRCHAEQWQDAYELMEQEQIFADLKRWGANAILLELYQLFIPFEKWHPRHPEAVRILTNLGRVYRTLGQRERARENLEQALAICQEIRDRWAEGTVLSFLGKVYADLGQKEKALKHLQEALVIRRDIDDREGISWTLETLSQVYDDLGEVDQAKEYSEQALSIREELRDSKGRGRILNTLAHIYDNLGQREQARRYLEDALRSCQEEGDRSGEALTLNRLGLFSASLDKLDTAQEYYEEALKIRREIGDRAGEDRTLNNLGRLYTMLGEREQAKNYFEQALQISKEAEDRWGEGRILTNLGKIYYDQRQTEKALEYLEMALKLGRETGDRRGEGRILQILGQIYATSGEKEQALEYFEQAIHIGQITKDGKGEAWTLYHVGRFYFELESYDVALACFLLARDIFEKMQSPHQDVVQQSIDTLSNTLGDAQFIELSAQVEPQAQQIVDQALHD